MKIENSFEVEKAARKIQSMGARNVLIKGGHLPLWDLTFRDSRDELTGELTQKPLEYPGGNKRIATDFLYVGQYLHIVQADYIETTATHGTGCTLAAAITANLANGKSLTEAVETAKRFVTDAIRTAPNLGKGHSPINQLVRDF